MYSPPSTTKAYKERAKFEERMIPGLFLGYEFGSHSVWRKHYRVMPLESFDELPLLHTAKGLGARLKGRATYTDDVWLPPRMDVTFPLRARAEEANNTIRGRRIHLDLRRQLLDNIAVKDQDGDVNLVEYVTKEDESVDGRPVGVGEEIHPGSAEATETPRMSSRNRC